VNNQILQLEIIGPKSKHQACVATHGLIGFNELMGVRYCYYHQIIEIILNGAIEGRM
jgi:hypothetical protein